MSMSRKDFETIAGAIRTQYQVTGGAGRVELRALAATLADSFAAGNRAFDKSLFIAAATATDDDKLTTARRAHKVRNQRNRQAQIALLVGA